MFLRRLIVVVLFSLSACGPSFPVEPPEARAHYELALREKSAGNTSAYQTRLRKLADEFEDSKYGRRAALILASPAYQEGDDSSQAGAFEDFRKKIRAAGVRETLRLIYEAERAYYSTPRTGVFEEKLPARFIPAGPTPPDVPKGEAVFPPEPAFDEPGWRTLEFSQAWPMRFQYTVLTKGEGPGAQLLIRALGDIDGDRVYSVYELHAEADASGNVSQKGAVRVRDEGE